MRSAYRILVVDDDSDIHRLIEAKLSSDAIHITCVSNVASAQRELLNGFNLMLLDIRIPFDKEGIDLLKDTRQKHPLLPVIILSSRSEIEIVVEAFQAGAIDYFHKGDFSNDEKVQKLRATIINECEAARIHAPKVREAKPVPGFEEIIGISSTTHKMLKYAQLVAPEEINVLIIGATGTGKEILARAIHKNSARNAGPFVSLNCAAIPESLAESELFGHEKGAFTGAIESRKGKFELANKGTLFLDEVSEMPLGIQSKLLRALEERAVVPVGGASAIRIDCRIIAATNKNLDDEVNQHRFREDLFYRLNGFPIILPALNERKEDIPILVDYFIRKFGKKEAIPVIKPELMEELANFTYKGNIRQLINMIQYALVVSEGQNLSIEHFPMLKKPSFQKEVLTLKEAEKRAITASLEAARGNKSKAASFLGISRPTLDKKIKELDISLS